MRRVAHSESQVSAIRPPHAFLGSSGSKSCRLHAKKSSVSGTCLKNIHRQTCSSSLTLWAAAEQRCAAGGVRTRALDSAPTHLQFCRKHVDISDVTLGTQFNGIEVAVNRLVGCADGELKTSQKEAPA